MYEEYFHPFVPSSRPQSAQAQRSTRAPLLEQSSGLKAEVNSLETAHQNVNAVSKINDPPQATVARRAKSYTDFYYAARAQLKKDRHADSGKKNTKDNIHSSLEFEQYYKDSAEELVDASHKKYKLYLDQLRLSRQHLDSLSRHTSSNLELLATVSASFNAVDTQTSSFQSRCEGLLSEKSRLQDVADDIANGLQYYNLLEPITKRLNAPGAGHFVRREDFSQMLSNLDKCLEYMQQHPHHKEASNYQSRYRLLLTRALTLIRVHFTNTLREIAADVSKRIADRQLNETTMTALLYAKFRVGAADMKKLGLEIQKRAVPPPTAEPGAEAEYQSLMNELYQSYSAARGRLIVPLVRKQMAEIAAASSTSKDLVQFARSSISYIRGMCVDEYDLWFEWFDSEGGLYEFLEAMCESLFDYLRPRTIHETALPKLCEICRLIQVRYMDQQDDDSEPEENNQFDFSGLIRPALEDAQTRLVFVAQSVLRDDIERFKPKAGDLELPSKARRSSVSGRRGKGPVLSGRKSSNSSTQPPKTPVIMEEDGADPSDLQRYEAGTAYDEWYPTLRKAIWLLSRIYRLVNSTVFDDLAHEIVHQTTLSLQKAAAQVASKSTPADSQLFMLKQLLILKQQIVAFDIEYVTPEINFDFSNVTNTFWELRERGGLFNPANLLRLMGHGLMPRVVENMLDAKAELDGRLRTVINDFTTATATRITAAVSESAASKRNFDAAAAALAVRTTVDKEAPALRAKLDDFLDDSRIKETLVAAIHDAVAANYSAFFDRLAAANGAGAVSKKGKGRAGETWDPDSFADWSAAVFGVAPGRFEADDEGTSVAGGSVSGSVRTPSLSRRTSIMS